MFQRTPTGKNLNPPAQGKHLVIIQAESFLTRNGKARRADIYDFNSFSDDRVSQSDCNILWNNGSDISIKGSPADGSWEKWRQLFDGKFDSNSVIADPLFVDHGNRDYRLKPDFPALKLGFVPIDTSAIGLKSDFPSCLERQ